MASRSVARETCEPDGQLAFRWQRRAERVDPQPDRRGELLHAGLERVVAAHRTEHRLAEVEGREVCAGAAVMALILGSCGTCCQSLKV